MPYEVLFVDDEVELLTYWIDALKESVNVTVFNDVDEAVMEYNRRPFDAIIIDLMMPRGTLLKNDDDAPQLTGELMIDDIRRQMLSIPIIVFTAYRSETIVVQTKGDERALIIGKDYDPFVFTEKVIEFIDRCKSLHEDRVPERYFIRRVDTGEPIPVAFNSFTRSHATLLSNQWTLTHSDFAAVCRRVLPFVEKHIERAQDQNSFQVNKADVNDGVIHGILYRGPARSNDQLSCHFASAPKDRHGVPGREHKWVGKVIVAKLIRDFKSSQNPFGEFALSADTEQAVGFLRSLGFERIAETSIFTVDEIGAKNIIVDVWR